MQLYYIANAIVSGLRTTALSRNSLSSSHPPPITLIILIASITPIKILVVLYCGMIAFWASEGRFWH